MGKRIPVVITERLQSDLPEDKMNPQESETTTEKHEPNSQPPPLIDKDSSNIKKKEPGDGEEGYYSNIPAIRRFFQRNPVTPQGVFNGVVMIATVILSLVTKWQYDVQMLDQRPWVGVTRLHPKASKLRVDSPTRLAVVIRNSGKTPGINVRARMTAQGVYEGKEFKPVYVRDPARRGVLVGTIHPGQWKLVGIKSETPDELITQAFADDLQSGIASYYVYGQVGYDDIFEGHHCDFFCYVYSISLKHPSICLTYNKAVDAKCEDWENEK